eukprot:5333768-Amphidinium_carterae.1
MRQVQEHVALFKIRAANRVSGGEGGGVAFMSPFPKDLRILRIQWSLRQERWKGVLAFCAARKQGLFPDHWLRGLVLQGCS